MLRLVPPAPVAFCVMWHARYFESEPVHGALCCYCERDVAAPESARGLTVACIYCGLDRGDIPAEDIPPHNKGGE